MTRRIFSTAAAVALIGLGLGAWLCRDTILAAVGGALVVEDPLIPSDVMLLSNSDPAAMALEVSELYHQTISPRVALAICRNCDPLAERIRRLGIPYLNTGDLIRRILERRGVPADAITVLPERVDGTEAEVAAITAFVKREHLSRVMVVTARTHTARLRWLLRQELPAGTRLSVRSSRFDSFASGSWWHDRYQSREVVMEYLRWLNAMRFPVRRWFARHHTTQSTR